MNLIKLSELKHFIDNSSGVLNIFVDKEIILKISPIEILSANILVLNKLGVKYDADQINEFLAALHISPETLEVVKQSFWTSEELKSFKEEQKNIEKNILTNKESEDNDWELEEIDFAKYGEQERSLIEFAVSLVTENSPINVIARQEIQEITQITVEKACQILCGAGFDVKMFPDKEAFRISRRVKKCQQDQRQ